MVKNFTYRSKLEYESIIDISRLREKIEKDLAGETAKEKNVKLGYGGLMDIEFATQILQMIHGKKNHQLRETNTLSAITQLGTLGIIDHIDSKNIKKHYLFLRNLECALRIQNISLMSHLPKEQEKLVMLVKLLSILKKNQLILWKNLSTTILKLQKKSEHFIVNYRHLVANSPFKKYYFFFEFLGK